MIQHYAILSETSGSTRSERNFILYLPSKKKWKIQCIPAVDSDVVTPGTMEIELNGGNVVPVFLDEIMRKNFVAAINTPAIKVEIPLYL